MLHIIIVCLIAALVYIVLATLTGSGIVAIIGAILVLLAGIGGGIGDGLGRRGP